MEYPTSPTVAHVDLLHGIEVPDPYRWLEDIDQDAVQQWIIQQSRFTEDYLAKLPGRARIKERLSELWDFEKFDLPMEKNRRLFYTRNDGMKNQAILYWQDELDGEAHELLDPNQLSTDGTVALVGYAPSPDGILVAYGVSSAGSDWMTWKIRNVQTGQELSDRLDWVKFSDASWTTDSKGFYYSRYDAPVSEEQDIKDTNYYQKLYYHLAGTSQDADLLIHKDDEHKDWGFGGEVSPDGAYLVISVWKGTQRENGILYQRLGSQEEHVRTLLNRFDAAYSFLGNVGNLFYFETDHQAPNGKIIAIDIDHPGIEDWRVILPESKDAIQYARWIGGKIFVCRLHDVVSQLDCYDIDGNHLKSIELPGLGTIPMINGPAETQAKQAFFLFTNYFTPLEVYRLDLETQTSRLYKRATLKFVPSEYEMKQVFYASKDGTKIPMFICNKKGLDNYNGDAPTYLYGYGGFNIAYTPNFMMSALLWMELGGIFAVANIRGGSEYGKAWHEAGMKFQKQNVFDDFIAAAEWLIGNGITITRRLAIGGRSNGGLLVGACITQRPDLFGAALPIVGVMDMLRFHKFTIGWAWVSDYGSPDEPDEFRNLLSYSPYHNIHQGIQYPPTLICTGDHDDRVFPAHSFKFAARLQTDQSGQAPILIRIDINAGHGVGKPTGKLIDELTDQWSFLAHALSMKV